MYRKDQNYAWNGVKMSLKTASYTVLTSDEEIQVTPAANTTLSLPAISALAAAGLGPKCYKFSVEGSQSRYWVRILPSGNDTINGGQPDLFLFRRGEEIIIESTIIGDWVVTMSTIRDFINFGLEGSKFENLSFRTSELTGQLNALEHNAVFGAGGVSATGTMSYSLMRMEAHICNAAGTVMTARTAFFALRSHETSDPIVGNCMVAEFELNKDETAGSAVQAVICLTTRNGRATASYHNLSAYIQIRDYSTSNADCIGNLFSLLDGSLTWTIPASSEANKTAIFAAHAAGTENVTHYLKFSVGGTSYWIHCDATGPAAS